MPALEDPPRRAGLLQLLGDTVWLHKAPTPEFFTMQGPGTA